MRTFSPVLLMVLHKMRPFELQHKKLSPGQTQRCLRRREFFVFGNDPEPDDKPGYVVNGHLSDPAVAGRL